MKNGKILILLMTAVFLLLAAGMGQMEPAPQPDTEVHMPLSVTAKLDGGQEGIACWQDAAGNYIVFLPSGADLAEAVLSPEEDTRVILNGKTLEQETRCQDFQTKVDRKSVV